MRYLSYANKISNPDNNKLFLNISIENFNSDNLYGTINFNINLISSDEQTIISQNCSMYIEKNDSNQNGIRANFQIEINSSFYSNFVNGLYIAEIDQLGL